MRMSKSKVLLYVQCPRKFKFRYILGIPDDMHPSALIGIKVHEICDKFFDKIDMETDNAEEHFVAVIKEMTPIDADEKMMLYINNFCNYEIKRFNEMVDKSFYKPLYRELKIETEDKQLVGIIDRIDRTEDGLVLLDYKTGTPKNIRDEMYALSLYAKLVEDIMKLKIARVGILKLKNKNKILDITDIAEEDLLKAETITNKVRTLIAEEEFDKKVGNGCYWCSPVYKSLCEKIDKGEIKHIVDY